MFGFVINGPIFLHKRQNRLDTMLIVWCRFMHKEAFRQSNVACWLMLYSLATNKRKEISLKQLCTVSRANIDTKNIMVLGHNPTAMEACADTTTFSKYTLLMLNWQVGYVWFVEKWMTFSMKLDSIILGYWQVEKD